MFPYTSRRRWLLHSPPDHLVAAIQRRPDLAGHPLVAARIDQMQRYLKLRLVLMLLLYGGLIAAVFAGLSTFLPVGQAAARLLIDFIGTFSALTGALTLGYLFLSRLILQCQMDILGHFMLGMPYQH